MKDSERIVFDPVMLIKVSFSRSVESFNHGSFLFKVTFGSTVFTRISAAALIKFFALQVRRNRGRYKEIFSFNLTVYLPSIRVSNRNIFFYHCHHSPIPAHFSGVFTQLRSHCPFTTSLFYKKRHFQCGIRLNL